ncbi:ribosomal protein S6 glutaminyl transferase [Cronobacter phage vB_CsaP_009]|uniref:ATP-grasp enzyme n=1 Tax=Cronobacter phage vB_CsaP_009 TaxID=2699738 RepID=A0A679FDU4_9CAUD|nr:ribosomal protein S6 glutaminyl transferase [Cronobacter phage vB_CsaP_009]BBU72659.1 ATP-grasp enzyme [Cronobacter phage vB_CsaP_009]
MSRLAIFSHAPSDTVNLIREQINGMEDQRIIKIRSTGSTFRGRRGDLIVNYGSSSLPESIIGSARILNHPQAISNASNKRTAMNILRENNIPIVESTTDREEAQQWMDNGSVVYARTQLQGHSGAGIVVCANENLLSQLADIGSSVETSTSLVNANLYTKGLTEQRREFRIHVMNGVVTYVQQKRRRDGYREMEEYSNVVRNYHTGWIYATQNADVIDSAKVAAVQSVSALGLDYGAVDVITRMDNCWVLEVNTAPGMTGTNLETFCNNIIRVKNGDSPEGVSVDLQELVDEINETEAETPENLPLTDENWSGRFVRIKPHTYGEVDARPLCQNIGLVMGVSDNEHLVICVYNHRGDVVHSMHRVLINKNDVESFVAPRTLTQEQVNVYGLRIGSVYEVNGVKYIVNKPLRNDKISSTRLPATGWVSSGVEHDLGIIDPTSVYDSGLLDLSVPIVGSNVFISPNSLNRSESQRRIGLTFAMSEMANSGTIMKISTINGRGLYNLVHGSDMYSYVSDLIVGVTESNINTFAEEARAEAERLRAEEERIRLEAEAERARQLAEAERLSSGLTNNGIYLLSVNGENSVGVYKSEFRHFEIVAWEIPVDLTDCTVGDLLGELQTN